MPVKTYNTFLVFDCKRRKPILVTSSARKANELLRVGTRVEVWNRNEIVEKIYSREKEKNPMKPYINAEKAFIAEKQAKHEKRNGRRERRNAYEYKVRGTK